MGRSAVFFFSSRTADNIKLLVREDTNQGKSVLPEISFSILVTNEKYLSVVIVNVVFNFRIVVDLFYTELSCLVVRIEYSVSV